MGPTEVVTAFLGAITRADYDRAFELVTDDLEYDNVPVPVIHGAAEARMFLENFLSAVDETEWVVHRLMADGDAVFTERTDRFRFGDRWIDLPVAGVFELRDGKIALWRDYFDLQTALGVMQPQS
ncbi:MAG: limonene-1,2-epoxide hydrolase family protein [Actinomycetota bacterium]